MPESRPVQEDRPYVAALLLAGIASVAAQTPSQEPPVFRSDIDVVRLDVTVIDKDRKPIRDLKAEDFTVNEDGRPQRIVAVTEIRASEDPPLTARMRFVPRDVTANDMVDRLGDGRVFVLLLDDFNVPFDDEQIIRETRQMARYMVDGMGPSDVAAVVYTFYAGNTIDFTDDRTKLLDAIDRFQPAKRDGYTQPTPQGMGPTEGDIVQRWAPSLVRSQCQRNQPLAHSIETVTRRLSAIPNRRKTVVLMTTGITLSVSEANGCPGELASLIRDAFSVAARTNINIYTVDPAGVRGYEEYLQHPLRNMKGIGFPRAMDMGQAAAYARRTRDFIKTVSENTGGRAIVSTDNIEGELDRMYAEDGSYYLVGYQSSNSRADGKFRTIKVSVKNRPGVEVRARSGYFAPRDGELARTDRERRASSNELALSGMTNPIGVSLRAAATALAPSSAGGRDAIVGFVLTLGYPASAGSITERLTVTRNVYELDGRAGKPVQENVTFELAPAGIDGQRKHLYYALPLPPGRRQVRFEIRSSTLDRSNSIVTEADVPDFSRSRLAVSGIVLGTGPSAGSPAEAALGKLVPILPTTEREFATNAAPTAFVRVFQGAAAARVPVRVKTEITDGRDATVFEQAHSIPAEAFGAEGAPVETPLSFERLERGPHVLSVTVEAPGVPSIRRDLLFRIR